jgi:hypothetical protein
MSLVAVGGLLYTPKPRWVDQLLARSAYVGAVCDPSRVIHHFQAAFAFPTWIVGTA